MVRQQKPITKTSGKLNPIRRINWFFIKKFSTGIRRNLPFRTSAIFCQKHFKNKPIVAIEIGTHLGESAEYLLKKCPNIKKLYCIDPWENTFFIDGKPASTHLKKAKKRLKKFSKRCKFIRKTSDEAISHFKKNSIDFIYIDGLHTYDQLSRDIENYFSLLKRGGILSGHDINRPEMAKAFFEKCMEKKQNPIISEMDWILVKK